MDWLAALSVGDDDDRADGGGDAAADDLDAEACGRQREVDAREADAEASRRAYKPLVLVERWYDASDAAAATAGDDDEDGHGGGGGGGGGGSDGLVKMRVDSAYLAGDYAKVIDLVTPFLSADRLSVGATRDLSEAAARSAWHLGRPHAALEFLLVGMARAAPAPFHPLHLFHARLLNAVGRFAEAVRCVLRFLDAEPLHAVGWTDLGALLTGRGWHAMAAYCWRTAASSARALKRDLPEGSFGRAQCERDAAALADRIAQLPADAAERLTDDKAAAEWCAAESAALTSSDDAALLSELAAWIATAPTR